MAITPLVKVLAHSDLMAENLLLATNQMTWVGEVIHLVNLVIIMVLSASGYRIQ
jgi:hypothetical protein